VGWSDASSDTYVDVGLRYHSYLFFLFFPLCGIIETILANHILELEKPNPKTGVIEVYLC
jgi:hypothetical protein